MKFDLHMHTTASDGTDTPTQLVSQAAAKGFDVIAITDHDTVGGLQEAMEAGEKAGVRVIPGVEISAGTDTEVHVLGYGIRDAEKLEASLFSMRKQRDARMRRMVEKLNRLGIEVTLSEVMEMSGGSVGRSHLARVLVEKGVVRDIRTAFARYLSPGRPAYVQRDKLTVVEAIELLRSAGALPVIAHPGQNRGMEYWTGAKVRELKEVGLAGLEAHHMAHSKRMCQYFAQLAWANNLLITGGSDYHGAAKTVEMGDGMQFWTNREEDFGAFDSALQGNER